MRNLLMIALCALFTAPAQASDMTLYLLRHAEKQADKSDPPLSENGQRQAQNLAGMLIHVPLSAIYSTDYQRTRQTVEPLATHKGLAVSLYDPSQLAEFAEKLRSQGQDVLVVGHSNTTPQLIELLGGQAEPMAETDYGDLYQLSLSEQDVRTVRLVIPY